MSEIIRYFNTRGYNTTDFIAEYFNAIKPNNALRDFNAGNFNAVDYFLQFQ